MPPWPWFHIRLDFNCLAGGWFSNTSHQTELKNYSAIYKGSSKFLKPVSQLFRTIMGFFVLFFVFVSIVDITRAANQQISVLDGV